MIHRLADVIGWTANGIAALCALMLTMAVINNSNDPGGMILFAFWGVVVFLVGRAVRYVLRGVA